jgi:spoIIIJ-associated protein
VGEPSVGTTQGDVGEIGNFVLGVVERLQVGPFEISESAEADLVVVRITGAATGGLSAGDGRGVDALQLLANQVVRKQEDAPRVVIDVEGNTEAREDRMGVLASRAADRAKKTGRAAALDPMNGRDRRAIHLALRDEEGVATMSIGEGQYRQVVIVPEGAPDYERAVRESEAASQSQDD